MKNYDTQHDGLVFRSRLEARWAAFFTKLGWSWEYEPIDLNGYIPDFILTFPHAPLLVEVKPAFSLAELGRHTKKIERSSWNKEALIVGAAVPLGESHWHPSLGLLAERGEWIGTESDYFAWDDAHVFWCLACRSASIFHSTQSYRCRVNGCYDGNGHLGHLDDRVLEQAWKAAHVDTRWIPRRVA